jgi:hypothetical protein
VRPKPLRRPEVWLGLVVLAAFWITVAVQGDIARQLPDGILATIFLGVLGGFAFWWTRIIVTGTEMIVRDAGMRTGRLARSEITAIHRRSFWINIYDRTNQRRLRIQPYYTVEQLRTIAHELGVPLIDHVEGRGLRGSLFG